MRWSLAITLAFAVLSTEASSKSPIGPKEYPIEWYRQQYPFIGNWNKIFSIETELTTPDKFRRPDSAKLSPFGFWMSYIPLWHFDKGVGSIRKGTVSPPDSISRAVRLPWRTSRLTDAVLPLQLGIEYLIVNKRLAEWEILPIKGEPMSYGKWLTHRIVYGPDQDILFVPRDTPLVDSEDELKQFLEQVSVAANYASLIANTDSIMLNQAQPGDLLIGCNAEGTSGKVYVIIAIVEKKKERRFLLGTGCSFACDFHIPRFGNDRKNPWLTADQLMPLVADWPTQGLFRLRLPQAHEVK